MRVILSGYALDANGATRLRQQIAGDRSNHGADALIAHVKDIGAQYVIVEHPYTDQDYSADYGSFYAGAFKDHPRATTRVHVFTEDVSALLQLPFEDQQAAFEQARAYLGFLVIRPIAQGPIGRTALPFPRFGGGLTVRPAARADFEAHLLGVKLRTERCAPFIQQDTRVGACAQAAIWMASRTVFARHKRTAWHSVAEITRLATTPTDAQLSQALPAGSAGLNPAHIIRALSGMGHQPLFDIFGPEAEERAPGAQTPREDGEPQPPPAPTASPSALRYLDSGLPVILGLGDVLHAVTAVGYVETAGPACRTGDTYDTFVHALIVHDDQRGPYRLLPLEAADAEVLPAGRLMRNAEGGLLTVAESVSHMFVPLPTRVFLSADDADIVARDYLSRAADLLWPLLMPQLEAELGGRAASEVQTFMELIRTGRLIRRTYLTSAGRYRHHLARSGIAPDTLQEILVRTLPHFVWVTELMRPTEVQVEGGGSREILGHMVVNATSSTDPDLDLLLVHAPHLLLHRNINPTAEEAEGGDFVEEVILLEDERPYRSRVRR
jgi:hypothetical protein